MKKHALMIVVISLIVAIISIAATKAKEYVIKIRFKPQTEQQKKYVVKVKYKKSSTSIYKDIVEKNTNIPIEKWENLLKPLAEVSNTTVDLWTNLAMCESKINPTQWNYAGHNYYGLFQIGLLFKEELVNKGVWPSGDYYVNERLKRGGKFNRRSKISDAKKMKKGSGYKLRVELSTEEQINMVYEYIQIVQKRYDRKIQDKVDAYLAFHYPAAFGRGGNIVYSKKGGRASRRAYRGNKELDTSKKGYVSRKDMLRFIERKQREVEAETKIAAR